MNILKQITLLGILILASIRLSSQSWERIFPNVSSADQVEFKKALPAANGDFLLLAGDGSYGNNAYDIHLLQINANGATQWVRHYDFGDLEVPQDMIATSDGGYAILYLAPTPNANTQRSYVLKLDASYNVVYRQEVFNQGGLVSNLRGKRIVEKAQQLIVFGTAYINDVGINTGCRYNLDLQSGAVSYYGELLSQESDFRAVTQSPDGNFVAISQISVPGTPSYRILATQLNDQSGGIDWQTEITGQGSIYLGNDITAAPDGGYLVAGSSSSQGLLARLDAAGNELWQHIFPFSNPPDSLSVLGFEHIIPTVNGDGYWATGPNPLYIPQIVLGRFDLQGNVLWHKTLGVPFNYNYARNILATTDDGCLLTGTRSLQTTSKTWVPYAIRVNSAGNSFTSGVSGKLGLDYDNDCIGDVDTLLYGTAVNAWQNGLLVSSGAVGPDGRYAFGLDTGDYLITVEKPNNAWTYCPDTIPVTVVPQDTVENLDFAAAYNPQPIDSIFGLVFNDVDGDCVHDPFETLYPGWTVTLVLYDQGMAHTFSTVTDAGGHFVFSSALSGFLNSASGNFSIAPPAGDGLNCTVGCPDAFNVHFQNSNSFEANFGMHCDSLPPCPVMYVDIATNGLRPCRAATYNVHYCNNGAVVAENAGIAVTIDPRLNVTGSSIPWASVSGSTYTFPLGNLTPEQCGDFTISVFVPCTDPVGTTYCVEAHAYPDTICQPSGPNWDGSQIEVNAACDGDSVFFTIQNVGNGNMVQPLNYIVIEDNVMLMQAPGQFQLNAGASTTVGLPATGAFYRLEADQTPGYPGLNQPVAWAEGCGPSGNNISLGFVNQYALPDDEPWLDIFCLESVASFDPNDKNGFPRGVGSEHFVEANTDIEYVIRFQNTGTAPADDVELRDTIPVQYLDPTSVRPGASSHPYEWDMQGNGVVVFRFPGINLPDSSESQEASQGFVKFRVAQRLNLPVKTQIRNSAAIYFDQNTPVITNQTLHTIGKDFVTVGTANPAASGVLVQITPNPMNRWVTVRVDGLATTAGLRLRLVDHLGRTALERDAAGTTFGFDATALPAGIYYYELRNGQQLLAQGKLIRAN